MLSYVPFRFVASGAVSFDNTELSNVPNNLIVFGFIVHDNNKSRENCDSFEPISDKI